MANRALVWNSGGQSLVEMKGLQNRYLKIQMQTQASKNLVKSSVKNKVNSQDDYQTRALTCKKYFICFNGSPLKMMKNTYFLLKALFVLKIFKFCPVFFLALWENNIYDVTNWETNKYNTHISQHLNK